MAHRPNLYYSKIYQKGNWKKNIKFPLEQENTQPTKQLAQLSIWRGGLGIFDIDTQLNYIKIKSIQRLLNPTNALWKDLMLYWLKSILNSDESLEQNNEDFFTQLQYAWLHLTNNNSPAPISIEEIFDQPIFSNPHTRLEFKHPTQFISDKFTITRDLCRFLQPGLISSTIFRKKLDFPAVNHKRYINLLWDQFPIIGKTHSELKLLKNLF